MSSWFAVAASMLYVYNGTESLSTATSKTDRDPRKLVSALSQPAFLTTMAAFCLPVSRIMHSRVCPPPNPRNASPKRSRTDIFKIHLSPDFL